jgi:hypothetical protein
MSSLRQRALPGRHHRAVPAHKWSETAFRRAVAARNQMGRLPRVVARKNGNQVRLCSRPGRGIYGDGTVFEIVKTASGYASTPITLVNFDWSNGAFPFASVMIDPNGNLFGTTTGGGNGYGTVFEIAKTTSGYASSPITTSSASMPLAATERPQSAQLDPDANGGLLGVTRLGGANGDGTIFEIKGAFADGAGHQRGCRNCCRRI